MVKSPVSENVDMGMPVGQQASNPNPERTHNRTLSSLVGTRVGSGGTRKFRTPVQSRLVGRCTVVVPRVIGQCLNGGGVVGVQALLVVPFGQPNFHPRAGPLHRRAVGTVVDHEDGGVHGGDHVNFRAVGYTADT